MLTDPQALRTTSDAVAAAADALAAVGDAAGEAKGHFVHATALQRLGKVGACETALDRALAAARRVDDGRRSNAVLAVAPLAALWGPSPVTRASGRCLDVVRVLRITQGAPAVEAVALRCQAVLEALRGRTEAARRMIASSRRMVEELGITQGLLETEMFAGLIELIEGDSAAAEHSLRAAYDGLRDHGLGIDAARAAGLLGITLLAQGRAADAEALSHESEALAGDDLQAAITWRRVRAEALAQRGESVAAVAFARAAVDFAAATDALLHHADARLALAAALRAAGRSDAGEAAAATEEARAIELWEAKGATVLADRARRDAGRVARGDQFPAVARTSVPAEDRVGSPQPIRRRVSTNEATAIAARLDAAFTARDAAALPALLAEEYEVVDHPTGRTYDRRGALAADQRALANATDMTVVHEPVATLGDSLSLCRRSVSGSGVAVGKFDIGAYESERIVLIETDAQGQRRRSEVFATNRLADALARLYERYAEILPDGPARARAAATARAVAIIMGPLEPDRWPFAPAIEFVDHRTVGLGSVYGAPALRRGIRALLDLSEDFVTRLDDVLALRSDALLVRWTNFGTDRASGGTFERDLCQLLVFGHDGLVTRWEQREAERDGEALARFDGLVGINPSLSPLDKGRTKEGSPTRTARRIRPNAATAHADRFEAAMAARDVDAIAAHVADGHEVMNHTTGAVYDWRGLLPAWRSLLRDPDAVYRQEPLASLGDSLTLYRQRISGSGVASAKLDVGAFETEKVVLLEVDAQGRRWRDEVFAADRLGDAVARLYERYAELLPDGPERERAAATARSIAAVPLVGPYDLHRLDRIAPACAPAIEYVDHRTVGMGSVQGAEALLKNVRALLHLSEDSATRTDDVLALRPDALLVRWTHFGTDRASGGTFERRLCHLWIFGTDGLLTRGEQFDAEREDEALARFDELTGEVEPINPSVSPLGKGRTKEGSGPARRLRTNAASTLMTRIEAAFRARDIEAVAALCGDPMQIIEHSTGATYGRECQIESSRQMMRMPHLKFRIEVLATLGELLCLNRCLVTAGGTAGGPFDVAEYEIEYHAICELDAVGRCGHWETFAPDKLGAAVVRLYERYAELRADGPERDRAAATARSVAVWSGPPDLDRFAASLAPSFECADRRIFGTWSAHGAQEWLQQWRFQLDLVTGGGPRLEDVLALEPHAYLVRSTYSGANRSSGGTYENHLLALFVFGTDGLLAMVEAFEADAEDEALARFDELTGPTQPLIPSSGRPAYTESPDTAPKEGAYSGRTGMRRPPFDRAQDRRIEGRRVRANAASANTARMHSAIAARDVDALPTLFADDLEVVDHTTGVTFDREGELSTFRALLSARNPTSRHELLATLGDSLALSRGTTSASGFAGAKFDVGAYERETVGVINVDAQGRRRRIELFAADRLGDAVVRLYVRYAELLPDGPERDRAAATARSVAALLGPFDLERWATAFAPAIEYVDDRTLGLGSAHGAEHVLQLLGSLLEVADGVANRVDDVLGLRSDALLAEWTNFGTDRAGGGAYERHFLWLGVLAADGLLARIELFEAERDAEALGRFDELAGPTQPLIPSSGRPAYTESLDTAPKEGAYSGRTGMRRPPFDRAQDRRIEGRRIRPNAATANADRFEAAIAARDIDAIAAHVADGAEVTDHTTGAIYAWQKSLPAWSWLLRDPDAMYRQELLASLGDSLTLYRQRVSGGGVAGAKLDVGAFETEKVVLLEVDAQGRNWRNEVFAADRLGDAVARLYERYADLLRDGPKRTRAAATARSVAAMLGPYDPDRFATASASAIEVVDHRTLGTWSARGVEAMLQHDRSWLEVADEIVIREDDVLGLQADACLVRRTLFGTVRASGGAFERQFILLRVFGTDGLVARREFFDSDREAEALARFDELTQVRHAGNLQAGIQEGGVDSRLQTAGMTEGQPSVSPLGKGRTQEGLPTRTARRVRPNAATAHTARLEAMLAMRDADALPTLFAEDMEAVHHPTGATYGQQGSLTTWRSLLRADDPSFVHDVLATLGDSLALYHLSTSASGFAGGRFDVGAYERVEILLVEVDASGRRRRSEIFAADRLGDAIARLYERYAELFPEGPEGARAAATARSVAALVGPPDLDRRGPALAPAVEFVDHRPLGFPSTTGAEVYLRRLGSLIEVSGDIAERTDDVLALRSDALLVRWMSFGTDRASGGAFERAFLNLYVFGADGLATRNELFDVDRVNEALARFDELVLSPVEGLTQVRHAGNLLAGIQEDGVDSRLQTAGMTEGPPSASPLGKGRTKEGSPAHTKRRVRPNAATANAARFEAALAARDADALLSGFADDMEGVHHPSGATYDRQRGFDETWRSLRSAENLTLTHEPLATLGESLALCRLSASASGVADGDFDVGAYEREEIMLIEADAQGRRRRVEFFADYHLGDAITRLYERYAGLLPDGPERARAAATARSVATVLGPFDPNRYATAIAPAIEVVDHRTLGTWSARGAQALLQHYSSLLELADDIVLREDEVLSLQSHAFLVHRTHLGTDRASGGAYEKVFLSLFVFGTDGLLTRIEWFDAERDAEALARFDELTQFRHAGNLPAGIEDGGLDSRWVTVGIAEGAQPVRRHVPPNAATATVARLDAAMAACNADALPDLLADDYGTTEHTTGARYDRDVALAQFRSVSRTQDLRFEHQPLATLGSSLGLFHLFISGSGAAGARFDVGSYETEIIVLREVDAQGRLRRADLFPANRLGDAIVRLSERYAELLPEGPERDRATAIARSVAASVGPFDPDREATAITPDIEFIDHRLLGFPDSHGAEQHLKRLRSYLEVSTVKVHRIDDILGVTPNGLLLRWFNSGTAREGGGDFEREFLILEIFGPDGRKARQEMFAVDGEAEALARFDELTQFRHAGNLPAGIQDRGVDSRLRTAGMTEEEARAKHPSVSPLGKGRIEEGWSRATRIENAATRLLDRFEDAWSAHDWDRIQALFAPGFRSIDRWSYAHLDLDRDEHLASLRFRFDVRSSRWTPEVLATRGDRLVLTRARFDLADGDTGPSESVALLVFEGDEHSAVMQVAFDPDALDAAYAELDARYAAGEAAPYARPWEMYLRNMRAVAARDWEQFATAYAPDCVMEDHRPLGLPTARSRDECVASLRAFADLRPDATLRVEHVLALDERRLLTVTGWVGSEPEGKFEIPVVAVVGRGPDGRVERVDTYDLDRLEEARAKFEELRSDPLRIPPNAASRAGDRNHAALEARDWEAVTRACAPTMTFDDRRRSVLLTGDRDMFIASSRVMASVGARMSRALLATAGDRLSLEHHRWTGATDAGAPSTELSTAFEAEILSLREVDAEGRIVAIIAFDPDDRRAAFAEAQARFVAGEAAAIGGHAPIAVLDRAFARHDWETLRGCLTDEFVLRDHRALGVLGVLGPEEWVDSLRVQADLAPDVNVETLQIIAWNRHGSVDVGRVFGTIRAAGPFENVLLRVKVTDGDHIQHWELFDVGDTDRAQARFAELCEECA